MAYEPIPEARGVVFRLWGVASDDDFQRSGIDIYDHPSFETLEYLIVDFTDVTALDLSSSGIRGFADLDAKASKRNPSLRVAIISEELLLLGLTNMYLIEFDFRDGTWEQALFTTMVEARAWLADEDQCRYEC